MTDDEHFFKKGSTGASALFPETSLLVLVAFLDSTEETYHKPRFTKGYWSKLDGGFRGC